MIEACRAVVAVLWCDLGHRATQQHRLVRATPFVKYFTCSSCRRRWHLPRYGRGWFVVDHQWLAGGEWTRTPTAPPRRPHLALVRTQAYAGPTERAVLEAFARGRGLVDVAQEHGVPLHAAEAMLRRHLPRPPRSPRR